MIGLGKATCVSVNGIIWLMESVCLRPKVIPLSGAHCTVKMYHILFGRLTKYLLL